jgi:uncharacterized protein YkuJ
MASSNHSPEISEGEETVEINTGLFRPGVLNRLKQIAKKGGAILLLHKGGNEKITTSFGEIGKIIQNISFFHSNDRGKVEGPFDGTFFIDSNGMVNFA